MQAGVGICTPQSGTAPVLTSQCSCCPSPQDVVPYSTPRTPPLSSAPGCQYPWGHTLGFRRKTHLEKKGKILYLSRSEVRSRTSSSASWQSLKLKISTLGHGGEHGRLGV